MGPKRRSLAHLQRILPRGAALALLAAAASATAQEQAPPRPIPYTERAEVRRVQVDVSVIDPKGDSLASVPGLTRDMFELRLDGVRLTPEEMARVEFDEICPARTSPRPEDVEKLADERPTLIAFVDLNFLDVRMRHATARAIDDLSKRAAAEPMRVKVIAYTRQLISLTPDFTSDPEDIARAGRMLLQLTAIPPPIGTVTALPRPIDRAAPIDSAPMSEQTDASAPIDPNREVPAFQVEMPDAFDLLNETGELRFASALGDTFMRDVDARPSLAALEAVLLSHAGLRGRKALVIFSSSWFDLPDSQWLTYLVAPRQAAQGGFTIWAVDARGLSGGVGAHTSGVLKYLTASTGGDIVRSAGRLAIAFERALSQLSCYYLFTIPVPAPREGEKEHAVDVLLDTKKHPELWRHQVRTVSGVTLLASSRLRERRRLAALMAPDSHKFPEVRVTAAYPSGEDNPTTVIEIASMLSDFTFTADKSGGLSARFALEGVVTDRTGRTICRLGDGQERVVRSAQPPARFPPSMLVVGAQCALPGPGVYNVRVIVEDVSSADVGAAEAQVDFAALTPGLARVSSLRLGRNSGRDFVFAPAKGRAEIPRDQARRAFIPLEDGEAIVPQDRLLLRFVACGVAAPPRVIVYQRGAVNGEQEAAAPAAAPRALFEALVSQRAQQRTETSSCGEFEAVVPESTLAPGAYGLRLIDPPAPAEGEPLPGDLPNFGSVEFRVVPPNAPPPEAPRRKT